MLRTLPVALFPLLALAADPAVVFENVNVIPMDRERVIERQTVIIRDGRIVELGPASKIKASAGALRIDGTGKYLMPGLAEMHGHLPGPTGPPGYAENVLALYIANGVTTVRGMLGNQGHLELRRRIASGEIPGPALYVAGPALSGQSATSPEVAQRMVREQKAAGYDLLKMQEGLRRDVYDAIVETARSVDIPFGGHVAQDVGIHRAIETRPVSIDHLDNYLDFLAPDAGVTDPLRADERKIPELARKIKAAGIWSVPTMALWEVFNSTEATEALRRRPEVRYMPRQVVDQWEKSRAGMIENLLKNPNGAQAAARTLELRKKVLKGLRDAGAKIALGTDSPQLFSVPGFSIHREMRIMVDAGMTPYEVLVSGTRNVAEYFGTLPESGTVALRKRADLILLTANPLQDIANVARRAGVMVRGRWIPEQEIQQRLEKIAGL